MKYFSIAILAYLLCSYSVVAGLPPTSTQGSAGGGYNTTFKFNFPYIPITQSGTIASFERVPLDTGVTNSLSVTHLNDGVSASSSTFWRGDGTWAVPPSSGDVVGPASSTDNAAVRFDGTTGKLVQDSSVIIGDTANVSGVANLSASGIVTASQGNFGGAIGNGATIGALNVKGTDSLGSQLQLEGPNSSNANRFLYMTQRENGDYFMYNPGLNRVILDYNAASNATTIGQSGGNYQFNVQAADPGTAPATILQGSGLGINNPDTTDGNFSVLGFQGSASGRAPDSAIYGIHDDHNGATSTGSMEFWTRNAGTFARAARISPTKILTLDGYSTGCLQTDGSGVVTSSACVSQVSPTSIGTIDSQTKSANGLVTSSTVLYAQTADVDFPGMVSTSTQAFAGAKTFRDTMTLGTVTASRPLKSDASKGVTSSQIILSSTDDVVGTLPVGNGGLGISSTPTNGQIPIGNGTNYAAATITAGSNITITNGAGAITVSASGGSGTHYNWRGRHEYPCGWSTAAAAYTDVGGDANCTFTTIYNNGMGTVASMVSASSLTAGIFFTPPATGDYEICATTPFANDASGQAAAIRMIDNVSYEWARDMSYAGSSTTNMNSETMCGIASLTSGVSRSIRIQMSVPAFSGNAVMGNQVDGGETDYYGIEWKIISL